MYVCVCVCVCVRVVLWAGAALTPESRVGTYIYIYICLYCLHNKTYVFLAHAWKRQVLTRNVNSSDISADNAKLQNLLNK